MYDVNVRFVMVACVMFLLDSAPGRSQQLEKDVQEKLDSIVAAAYQVAASEFPCKTKTRGKIRMIRWQDADKCLNEASNRVDWGAMTAQLAPLRAASKQFSPADFTAAVQASFSSRSLPYEKIFAVKREDAHLPLTNSVVRFLPPDSLEGVPVVDNQGKQVGTFAGTYFSERTGGLATANTFRLALFQYKDANENLQTPSERLLLDSFGVPWRTVKSQPGFRLTTEKLGDTH